MCKSPFSCFSKNTSYVSPRSEPLNHSHRHRFRASMPECMCKFPFSYFSRNTSYKVNVLTKRGFSIDWTILMIDYYSKGNLLIGNGLNKLMESCMKIKKEWINIWKDYMSIFLSLYGSLPLLLKKRNTRCVFYSQLQCSTKPFKDWEVKRWR